MSNFKDLDRELRSCLEKVVSKNELVPLSEAIANMVKVRTRLGYGVSRDGAPRARLKPLSDSYKKQRKGEISFYTDSAGRVRPIKNKNKSTRNKDLSHKTQPSKSNLTYTGELIDSIEGKVPRKGVIIVGPTGQRNLNVSKYVSDQRPYLALSKTEIKKVETMIRQKLERCLKSKLTKL